MKRSRVNSEAIRAIGYDAEGRKLEVEFTTGRVYRYLGVPVEAHAALMRADSIGGWFNRWVKPLYHYRELPR